jgi:hypothetical protein
MVKRATLFFVLACSVAAVAQAPRESINIQQRMVVLESAGSKLKVNELYNVEYSSALADGKAPQRTLEIYLPDRATIEQAAVRPDGNTALQTGLVARAGKNLYAFTYPLRPGKTQFTVTYTLPYSGELKIVPRVTGPTAQLMLITPDSMSIMPDDNSVFVRASDPMLKDVNVFVASNITQRRNLRFAIRGAGTLARPAKEGKTGAQASQPEGASRRADARTQDPKPTGGASPQWIFLAVLLLFFAAAATYLSSAHQTKNAAPDSPPGNSLLSDMKEEIFQLESDRLQGKLSADEYETAKAALDKAMRKAVERATKS